MLKIIISGCNGHMGRVVAELCEADPALESTAGFDVLGAADREFPVFTSPAQFTGEADAVIDFSSPAALDGLLRHRDRGAPPPPQGGRPLGHRPDDRGRGGSVLRT